VLKGTITSKNQSTLSKKQQLEQTGIFIPNLAQLSIMFQRSGYFVPFKRQLFTILICVLGIFRKSQNLNISKQVKMQTP